MLAPKGWQRPGYRLLIDGFNVTGTLQLQSERGETYSQKERKIEEATAHLRAAGFKVFRQVTTVEFVEA